MKTLLFLVAIMLTGSDKPLLENKDRLDLVNFLGVGKDYFSEVILKSGVKVRVDTSGEVDSIYLYLDKPIDVKIDFSASSIDRQILLEAQEKYEKLPKIIKDKSKG